MRRLSVVLAVVALASLTTGLANAVSSSSIAVEETIVLGEHTVKGRVTDLAGKTQGYQPGDRYLFRSRLTDDLDARAGSLSADCLVHFRHVDACSQIYDLDRGTITAEGLVPVDQLVVDGTWTLAITGGTGDFENVRGAVSVSVLDEQGNTEHTLHLIP
jgi:hypothetical protein